MNPVILLRQKSVVFAATGCYMGYIPFAPGTFGSLVGIPFVWLMAQFSVPVMILFLFFFIAFAIIVAGEAEKVFRQKDSGFIVIDEIAGMLVTFFLVPWSPGNALVGLLLFRIFDITKPFPVGLIDRKIKGGIGVVADDIVAGFYANAVLRLVLLLFGG